MGEGESVNHKNEVKKELSTKKHDKQLMYLKIVMFLFMGGKTAYLPFLTLHMQDLGITTTEIGIIYAFLPIASLMGPPMSGIIADQFGHYKSVLLFNKIASIILHSLLLTVPARPKNTLNLNCGSDGHTLTWDTCHPCHNDNLTQMQLSFEKCEYDCDIPSENFTLCLHDNNYDLNGTIPQHCRTFNLTQQVTINGSLSSMTEQDNLQDNNDICTHSWLSIFHQDKLYTNLTCPGNCFIKCKVSDFPECLHPDDLSNSQSTFWIYFVLRMVGTFFLASSFTMMDAMTMAITKIHNAEYGKQKMLATLGQGVVPLIAGILVDRYHHIGYAPVFYLGAVFIIMSSIITLCGLHVQVDPPSKTMFKELRKLIMRPEIDLFLIMILVMGSNWGYIESYLFVYLIELKAPHYLLGLTLTVGCLVGIPVLYVADTVVKKLGRPTIFIISFFSYTARHLGYAYMPGPWLVFPFELFEVFTYQIMWVAACTYCPILAPRGLLATMTGLAGATHYSLGRGVGALLGGNLIANYGMRITFQIFAIISLVSGIIYILTHFLCFKKVMERREAEAEEEERRMKEEGGEEMDEIQEQVTMLMLNGSRRTSLADY